MDEASAARLHYELIHGLIQKGSCPTNADLASMLGMSPSQVDELLCDLSSIHGVVLHPHVCEPWILHPFSLTPTINWIQNARGGWWAPCLWCAFGAATLLGGEARIQTRYGAESEPLTIPVMDGHPDGFEDVVVHFAIPPARAWDNVHQHCALVLPFRSAAEIREWSTRHGLPIGEAVPLYQVAQLARIWYGSHAEPQWRKWTVAEAQDIFRRAGLTSDFWNLSDLSGKF